MFVAFQSLAGSLDSSDFSAPLWIAAVVAAVAVALAALFWKMIVSNLSRFWYRIPLAGRWTTKMKKGSEMVDHESVQLFQLGSRVWGQTETNDANRRRYRIRGRIIGEKLCMIYREMTKPYLDAGAILLQIGTKGDVMEGYEVSVSFTTRKVAAQEYEWKRV